MLKDNVQLNWIQKRWDRSRQTCEVKKRKATEWMWMKERLIFLERTF